MLEEREIFLACRLRERRECGKSSLKSRIETYDRIEIDFEISQSLRSVVDVDIFITGDIGVS